MKQAIKRIPIVGPVARLIHRLWFNLYCSFQGSNNYWINRYEIGGHSGDGSYNELADFKASILNAFVLNKGISSVIEFGCGDGNQLSLAHYKKYIGFDVSPNAISRCQNLFHNDKTKSFKLMKEYSGETAELTLSLDVIYHLVEDAVFFDYMNKLFDASERFVAIYSSDKDEKIDPVAAHVRHRNFSKWIKNNKTDWKFLEHIPNKYPFNGDTKSGSFADFYFYEKRS